MLGALIGLAPPLVELGCARPRPDEPIAAATSSQLVTVASAMHAPRKDHAAVLLDDGTVLVVGGLSVTDAGSAIETPTCEIYSPVTGAWTVASPLAWARSRHHVAKLANGDILAFGGTADAAAHTERRNHATGLWGAAKGGLVERAWAAWFHRASDDNVVVIGGQAFNDGSQLASSELYDPPSNLWRSGPTMTVPREAAGVIPLSDDKYVVAGGYDGASYRDDAEICTISTNTCVLLGGGDAGADTTMTNTRARFTTTRLTDGRWLLAGGYGSGGSGGYDSSTSIFDPSSLTFTAGPTLVTARNEHTATLLPSGAVLIAGGEYAQPDDAGVVTPVNLELVDVTLGTIALAAPLADVRYAATATLLSGSTVLIAGGGPDDWGSGYRSVASASLFSLGAADSVCG
ncbi:MAG: Kelch repeat-containing protein, partial [Polyangiales bacterium]